MCYDTSKRVEQILFFDDKGLKASVESSLCSSLVSENGRLRSELVAMQCEYYSVMDSVALLKDMFEIERKNWLRRKELSPS